MAKAISVRAVQLWGSAREIGKPAVPMSQEGRIVPSANDPYNFRQCEGGIYGRVAGKHPPLSWFSNCERNMMEFTRAACARVGMKLAPGSEHCCGLPPHFICCLAVYLLKHRRAFLSVVAVWEFATSLLEWPPKLRHGKMWKYGTVLKEGELGDEPSL
jgi:hypothetical protein